jgi:hypothetical protein
MTLTSNSGSDQQVAINKTDQQGRIRQPEVAHKVRPKVVRTVKTRKADKLQRLMNYLLSVNDQKFTGYIKVNFTQGAIGRIERFEEILTK